MTERKTLWSHHPAVKTGDELTAGEKAADVVRNQMGSWKFVFCFAVFLLTWALINSWFFLRPFDPYPYILLNLFLSMLAAIQGAILLISAKRADSISSAVSLHTYENTQQLTQLIQDNTKLTEQVHSLTRTIHKILENHE